jgi:hypothetical protein
MYLMLSHCFFTFMCRLLELVFRYLDFASLLVLVVVAFAKHSCGKRDI